MAASSRSISTSNAKCTVIAALAVLSLIASASVLHSSVYLHRTLSLADNVSVTIDPKNLGSNDPSAKVNQDNHSLLRDVDKQQLSHSIDGNDTQASSKTATNSYQRELNFVLAGFPKTGTTSMLYAFGEHSETDIAPSERCAIINPAISEDLAKQKLREALQELSPSPNVQRAIKCPNAVYHAYHAIVRMEQYAPNVKFVLGLRHPVLLLESFYNYRVTELHDKYLQTGGALADIKDEIPPMDRLIGVKNEWKDVSTDSTNFKKYLLQFGKTNVNASELRNMTLAGDSNLNDRKMHSLAIKPNIFPMFLYTVEQMKDPNVKRSAAFRSVLQKFLGLREPIKPMGRENLNHFVGHKAYPETADICLPKYKSLRQLLLKQGRQSAVWIEEELLASPAVVVANPDQFLEHIRSWSRDPCSERIQKKIKDRNKKAAAVAIRHGKGSKKPSSKTQPHNLNDAKQEKRRVKVGRNRKLEVFRVHL